MDKWLSLQIYLNGQDDIKSEHVDTNSEVYSKAIVTQLTRKIKSKILSCFSDSRGILALIKMNNLGREQHATS